MPTPHNNALNGQIAETVLMPGDPLRAKFIAENFLTGAECVNTVRNALGFTGTYKGEKITVQASGMGIPSMCIYSYELFTQYGVENIIRIGTAGGLAPQVNLKDVVIAMGACTNSNYASQYGLRGSFAPIASYKLLEKAVAKSKVLGLNCHVGNILTSDTFYDDNPEFEKWIKMGVLAVEMETAGLYMNASRLGKNALCITTVSDCPLRNLSTSAEERQTSFTDMMELALETAVIL